MKTRDDKMLEALAWGAGGAGVGTIYGLLQGMSDQRNAYNQNTAAGIQTGWSGLSRKMPMGKTVVAPDPGMKAIEGAVTGGLTGAGLYGDLNKSFSPDTAINIGIPVEPIEGIVEETPILPTQTEQDFMRPQPSQPRLTPDGSYSSAWTGMGPSVIGKTKIKSALPLYQPPARPIAKKPSFKSSPQTIKDPAFREWLMNNPPQTTRPKPQTIMRGPAGYLETAPMMNPWYAYGGTGGR